MKTVATENINPAKRTDHTYADFPGTMEESSKCHMATTLCKVFFALEQKLKRWMEREKIVQKGVSVWIPPGKSWTRILVQVLYLGCDVRKYW